MVPSMRPGPPTPGGESDPPAYRVREAARADLATIGRLWREMMDLHGALDSRFRVGNDAGREFERHVAACLRARSALVLVAESDGAIVGYALGELHTRRPYHPDGEYGFISEICVAEAHRRAGIGRALVRRMTNWFAASGVTAVELLQAEANPVSAAFWHAVGFTPYLRLLRRDLGGNE